MDWSLVLLSQGIESRIDHFEETGWSLTVAEPEHDRAVEIIRQYRAENLRWPWRRKIRSRVLFDWGSLGWASLICVIFWISERAPGLREAGLMDSAAVSHGEWWRLSTAMFLHADLGHLAADAGIGLVLLGLTMGAYGTGVGLLASYLAGLGGNALLWLVYRNHLSLGASGMVMGCLGLLAAQSVSLTRRHRAPPRFILSGVVAGVMLFVLMGLSPGTDVVAHLGGFLSGLILGGVLTLFSRVLRRADVDVISGLLFLAFAALTWWLALRGISRT